MIMHTLNQMGGEFLGRKNKLSNWVNISAMQAKDKVGHTMRQAIVANESDDTWAITKFIDGGNTYEVQAVAAEQNEMLVEDNIEQTAGVEHSEYESSKELSPLDCRASIATQQIEHEAMLEEEAPIYGERLGVEEEEHQTPLRAAKRPKVVPDKVNSTAFHGSAALIRNLDVGRGLLSQQEESAALKVSRDARLAALFDAHQSHHYSNNDPKDTFDIEISPNLNYLKPTSS
jgi:hypothetical protein